MHLTTLITLPIIAGASATVVHSPVNTTRELTNVTPDGRCYPEYDDVDFPGYDIDAKQGYATECHRYCYRNDKCQAWTWTNHNGGTCWLKSDYTTVVYKPGTSSGFLDQAPRGSACREPTITISNCDMPGNDIGRYGPVQPTQKRACIWACSDDTRCKAWTWSDYNGGTCWLKSDRSQ